MTVAEEKTAHMRVMARGVAEGEPGTKFFASPTRARFLIGRRDAEMVNGGPAPADTGILRRSADWPMNRFSAVAREWSGKKAVLLGGGPSLTSEQVELVRAARAADRVRVIAINDAYRIAPFADICYFADSRWFGWHKEKPEFLAFAGEKCSIRNTGMNVDDASVHLLRNKHFPIHGYEISLDAGALATGRNSGYQAVNLAILAGAAPLILLGFDGKQDGEGRGHWFGEHPEREPVAAFAEYCKAFTAGAADIKAAGARVLNASPGSAIDDFEKVDLADCL